MSKRASADAVSGLLFVLIGAAGLWLGSDLRTGTTVRMGPGYMPLVLCCLLVALGVAISIKAAIMSGPEIAAGRLRPLVAVLASVAGFALCIQRGGILLAVMVAVATAALGSPEFRLREVAALGIVLALFSAGLFVVGLRLPMPIWPSFLVR